MIDMKVKNLFFDRKAVIDALGRARATVLAKAGSYIRRTARTLLRYGKRKSGGTSAPGEVPIVHTNDDTISLRNIQFSYDPQRESVVVGPVLISGKESDTFKPEGTVPQTLEFGGTVIISKPLVRRGPRRLRPTGIKQPAVARSVTYAPHPFMVPARDANLEKIPELWRDSIVRDK